MATNRLKIDRPEVVQKTRVETTYEYVPILGEVLGFWRKVEAQRFGETIEVHLNHTLNEYDRVLVNGEEIYVEGKTLTTNTNNERECETELKQIIPEGVDILWERVGFLKYRPICSREAVRKAIQQAGRTPNTPDV